MHVLGVSLLSLGVFGLLLFASHIAWQELKRLAYLSKLDDWAEDVEWH